MATDITKIELQGIAWEDDPSEESPIAADMLLQEHKYVKEYVQKVAKGIEDNYTVRGIEGEEIALNEYRDGKQVFKKIINCGNLPNNGVKLVPTGLTSIKFVRMEGLALSQNDTLTLPYAR